MKKFLFIIIIIEIGLLIFSLFNYILIQKINQPETFIESPSYQLAKLSENTYGGICYQYSDRMKRLYPETRIEEIIIQTIKDNNNYIHYFTHYRIILFEDKNLLVYTDSNARGDNLIRIGYEFK